MMIIEPRTNKDLPFSRPSDILIDTWMRALQSARNFPSFPLTESFGEKGIGTCGQIRSSWCFFWQVSSRALSSRYGN